MNSLGALTVLQRDGSFVILICSPKLKIEKRKSAASVSLCLDGAFVRK